MSDEDEEGSDISDQSDDSLSTKSSRVVTRRGRSVSRSRSRRRAGREDEEAGERDREDAISYASRNERGDRRRSESRRGSKRRTSSKKYGLDNIGPSGTSYSLWTSQKSIKRDHRRKFNRSLCGVLLGVSIVLVILGILGIIGIAVYLGVVQKIESPGKDVVSIDGAFRVVSEQFSLNLLNPLSPAYGEQKEKYEEKLENTFKNSYLQDAFVKVVIDGFSSGSIKVFFKVLLDKSKLPGVTKEDPVVATRDVMLQEVMSLDDSQFQDITIDIDSIVFSLSEVQDVAKKYLEPEPYQGHEDTSQSASLWQNLGSLIIRNVSTFTLLCISAQSTARPAPALATSESATAYNQNIERVDDTAGAGVAFNSYDGATPLNANGWTLPRYPTNTRFDQGHQNNLLSSRKFANVVTPQTPVIISQNNNRNFAPANSFAQNFASRLSPKSPSYPPVHVPSSKSDVGASGKSLMSEYLKPPPPPRKSAPPLNLEKLFMKQQSPPTMLESPSMNNARLLTSTPLPQIQNRKMEVNTEYTDKYNGFWNMLHKPDKGRLEPIKAKNLNSYQPRVSSKADRILSMQGELEHLLKLESEQNSRGPSLYEQIQSLDDEEIQQLADQLVPILDNQNDNSYSQSSSSWIGNSNQRKDPVSINNFGTSGFKTVKSNNNIIQGSSTSPRPTTVVDIHVPKGQETGFFGVGSSLTFSDDGAPLQRVGNTNSLMNRVPSLQSDQLIQSPGPLGSDPNIVYPQQIRAGTEMLQGPQGPLVSSPRPLSLSVPQTPLAPQVPHPEGAGGISRLGLGPRQHLPSLSPSHQNSVTSQRTKSKPPSNRRVGGNNVINSLLPAAIGLSGSTASAGISPIGIFSNLLNAYATIDSKHDLTGKLINSAASWFQNPETGEVRTSESVEITTQSTSTPVTESHSPVIEKLFGDQTTTTSPLATTTTAPLQTRRPLTNISVRVHDKIPLRNKAKNPYQSVFDKIRAAANSKESQYDVVTTNDFELSELPVKSNLFHEGPLRPKPPSEDIIQVSPSPQDYDNTGVDLQYGVSNPHWYSNEVQVSTQLVHRQVSENK